MRTNNDVLRKDPLRDRESVSSTLDQLLSRVEAFRASGPFFDAVRFVARLREYAPFNNLLVFLQRPKARYVATARDWSERFKRTVRSEAIPIVILRPGGPVMLVFDVEDTSGEDLPAHIRKPFEVRGDYKREWWRNLLVFAEDEGIEVRAAALTPRHAGTTRKRDQDTRFIVDLNKYHEEREALVTLCHELAHVFLGHLGPGGRASWPSRVGLSRPQAELEAETVAYLVTARLGLATRSVEYLAECVGRDEDYKAVSVEMITKVAGRLEQGVDPSRKTREVL